MTTKTKRTKGADLYPPKDIRENTKARRAWLAETLAEQNALPGVEAKIVDTGSYQRVSVWTLTEVAGRERTRGTCQICGGSQVHDGGLALHGYKRPRWGYIVGRCPGTAEAPAELDVTLTHAALASVERQIADATATLLAAGWRVSENYNGRWMEEGRETVYDHHNPALKPNRDLSHRRTALIDYAAHLRADVLPRHGQALTREIVTD